MAYILLVVAVIVVVIIVIWVNSWSHSKNEKDQHPLHEEQAKKQNDSNHEETAEKLFQQGEALRLDEPEKAFQYYLKAAEMGHVLAMTHVGSAYFNQGEGACFDPEKSADWYEKAAEQGEYNSMINLARYYMSGIGREEDNDKAKIWLQRAASASEEKYSRTAEIARKWLENYREIKDWIYSYMRRAVEFGGVPNQEAVELFEKAKECRVKEPEKAFELALKAAKLGNDAAMTYVGAAYLYQDMGARFSPEQSAYWYEKAANMGIPSAMIQLSGFYMTGIGKEENDSKAKMWLRKAAANTEPDNKESVELSNKWLEGYDLIKELRKSMMESAIEQGGIPQQE